MGSDILVEEQAQIVENIVGTEDVSKKIEESGDSFDIQSKCGSVGIPKDSNKAIEISTNAGNDENIVENFKIGLPDEIGSVEGIQSENGTIVYSNGCENVSLAVQANQHMEDGIINSTIREIVTINDADAPREYSFEIDVPEGYSLCTDYDVDEGELDEYDSGQVYIANDAGDILMAFDSAWAYDADNNPVKTEYIIDDNILIQRIDFSKNSRFPIVADPKGLSKTKYIQKNYKNTKGGRAALADVREKYKKRANNKKYTVINLLCIALGIATLGVDSALVSIEASSNKAYLDKQTIILGDAYIEMDKKAGKKGYDLMGITLPMHGTYKRKARQYIWSPRNIIYGWIV